MTSEDAASGGDDRLTMISAGPSSASIARLSALLRGRWGRREEHPGEAADEPSVARPRLVPQQRTYTVDGATIDHYDLSSTYFPGELLRCGGDGDWAWVVVLPFAFVSAPSAASIFHLFRALGPRPLAIVVDAPRAEADAELRALAAEALRDLLANAGYRAVEIPIVCGDLEAAAADADAPATAALLDGFAAWMRARAARPSDARRIQPFFMAIEDRFNLPHDQIVVAGRIDRGSLRLGDRLLLRGATTRPKRVIGIEMFRRRLDEAHAGDVVGIILEETRFAEVKRGDLLTDPRAPVVRRDRVRALVHLQAREVCGYSGSFDAATFVVHLRTASHRATMRLAADHPWRWDQALGHGRTLVVDLDLEEPCWYEPGARFGLRIDGMGAGIGVMV